ncbi:MAG TPA: hypothetical protein VJ508_08715, partial [Saprospiraceae bacterium]|nr:hypothetical protein [Saprospiraceae bacterium]
DRKRVSDPETIISRFGNEFEKLLLITMMGPWDEHLDAEVIGDFIKTLEQPAYHQSAKVA